MLTSSTLLATGPSRLAKLNSDIHIIFEYRTTKRHRDKIDRDPLTSDDNRRNCTWKLSHDETKNNLSKSDQLKYLKSMETHIKVDGSCLRRYEVCQLPPHLHHLLSPLIASDGGTCQISVTQEKISISWNRLKPNPAKPRRKVAAPPHQHWWVSFQRIITPL